MSEHEPTYYEDGVAYTWNDIKYTTPEFRKACRDMSKDCSKDKVPNEDHN